MMTTIEIGSSPAYEDCAQVGSEGYGIRAEAECQSYIDQLYRFMRERSIKLPESFRLVIKRNSHDFGTYYEVAARFDDDCKRSHKIANMLQKDGPTEWDDQAKLELNIA